MPAVQAQEWIAQLEETRWCLGRLCQTAAAVSIDAQQTMEQFTTIARDSQAAMKLLTCSCIIFMSMKLWGHNFDDDLNWWDFLSSLE